MSTGYQWQTKPDQGRVRTKMLPTIDRQSGPLSFLFQRIYRPRSRWEWGGEGVPESDPGEKGGKGIKGETHLTSLLQVS